jgi:hypothetical protein
MLKNFGQVEERIKKMREAFKTATGKELLQIVGHGKSEFDFCLEGVYQEFTGKGLIEVRIKEIQSYKELQIMIYHDESYTKIEQVTKFIDMTYLITIEETKPGL